MKLIVIITLVIWFTGLMILLSLAHWGLVYNIDSVIFLSLFGAAAIIYLIAMMYLGIRLQEERWKHELKKQNP